MFFVETTLCESNRSSFIKNHAKEKYQKKSDL